MTAMTTDPEPLPLEKLVARWLLALGPEGSATHAGSVQVPADDLRRIVEALAPFVEPLPAIGDPEDRFRLFLPHLDTSVHEFGGRGVYRRFHEDGEKTQIKDRPFFRPVLDKVKRGMGTVDMGTHIAEATFETGPDGEIVTSFVAGMKEKSHG